MNLTEKIAITFQMLENIEEADGRDSARVETSGVQSGIYDWSQATIEGYADTISPWLHDYGIEASLSQRTRHEAVATANVKNASRGRILVEDASQQTCPMLKPEGLILYLSH
jgi:hypothetical protein